MFNDPRVLGAWLPIHAPAASAIVLVLGQAAAGRADPLVGPRAVNLGLEKDPIRDELKKTKKTQDTHTHTHTLFKKLITWMLEE